MNGAPHLSRHDLQEQLEKLYAAKRSRRSLFAFHGTGVEDTVTIREVGEVRIVPVLSELDLRAKIPPISSDARIAFLMPWAGDIPMDLVGRFARDGRIMRIGREARLLRLFGVGEAESAVKNSPLVDYLLRPANDRRYSISESRLTADVMWSTWLQSDWEIEIAGGLASLMALAAIDDRGPSFVTEMGAEVATGVREALLAHLLRVLGPAGPTVWRAWEEKRGRALVEQAVLFETLAETDDPAVGIWMRQRARTELGLAEEGGIKRLGREAASALRIVTNRTGAPTLARTLARDAEKRIDEAMVRDRLLDSRRLPLAWRGRLDSLGAHLEAVCQEPRVDDVRKAEGLLRALETHEFFSDVEQTEIVRRAEMGVRLLAWLASRPETRIEASKAVHAEAENVGRWYVAEGGFVDLARIWARGTVHDAFGRGIDSVVRASDVIRQRLDRRFAHAVPAWLEAGRPETQVIPIDRAIERIATRFLEGDPSRRLLVMLLDGMAWAQAVELLASLGERSSPWGPLAWHFVKKNQIGASIYPVVFAGFPTITEVSRAAFFGSKLVEPGKTHSTQKDVDRWKANKHVTKFFEGTDAPPLMLRGEAHDKSGAASTPALTMVGDSARRVVAVVVNAIDESLKGDRAAPHRWSADSIRSMADLLRRAQESGRAVLLCSDHGHVVPDRMESRGMRDGGGRWRGWIDPQEALAEDEIAVSGKHVWCPRGAQGVVMLIDDTGRYGPVSGSGEHGGASLAEVVTPCLLIGCEDTAGISLEDDPSLAVRGALVPAWWHFDVGVEVETVAEEPPPKKGPKLKNDQQLVLIAPPPEPEAVVESVFAKSAVLAARVTRAEARKEIVRAVDFLLQRNGMATQQAFASEMGVVPRRVPGLVAKLQEVLNLDGYDVLRFQPDAHQVALDLGKLRLLFDLDA